MPVSPRPYQTTPDQMAASLEVDPQTGLSTAEATARLQRYGPNVLEQKHKISPWQIFFDQFKDVLIIILIIAAVVSLVLGLVEEGGSLTEGILIFAIVLAIAVVGFLNEYKAEKTVEALKRLVALRARVRRDGDVREIETRELVPGDVVLLEEGQKIPADIRLTQVIALQVNEASLTGESTAVSKQLEAISGDNLALGDQHNMVFSGTAIASGRGEGIVVATGSETEIGHIAQMVEEAVDDETPMQKKLDNLGKQLGVGILAVCAIVFVVILFLDRELQSHGLIQRLLLAFTAAVALAVAAIPEGLAFVVRISLALGARRMAGRKALVRRLSAVEALGSTDIICCDKTGTLTRGEMTVRSLWAGGQTYSLSGSGYVPQGSFSDAAGKAVDPDQLELLLKLGVLCNNARVSNAVVMGDPTEGALLVAAAKAKLGEVAKQFPRVGELPFSSDRKRMSTVHRDGDGYLVAVKGATEIVLEKCDQIWLDGRAQPLTAELRQTILNENHRLSTMAQRVLAFATKSAEKQPTAETDIESGLVFVGLQGMMDPPRTEIKGVIESVTGEAGMKVVMITGDYIETAKAVAAEIGIIGDAISGPELDAMDQAEFDRRVTEIVVYGRVNPEHKIRIVQALKQHGFQVAMTGDGVNDAPAIKAADIGIAMGETGTDVAKEAADLILLDDQFLTIVAAIEEGRGIFDNVRKFVNYLLSANIAEVMIVLFGILISGDLVVTAVQLLFINIVTDGLPAVALGSDPAEAGIMRFRPKRFQVNIINRRLWIEMVLFGALMSIAVLAHFLYDLNRFGLGHAVSATFTAIVILEMVRLINIRSDYRVKWLANPWLIVAIASSVVLQMVVLYLAPVSRLFEVVQINLQDWLILGASGALLTLVMKLVRPIMNRLTPGEPESEKLSHA